MSQLLQPTLSLTRMQGTLNASDDQYRVDNEELHNVGVTALVTFQAATINMTIQSICAAAHTCWQDRVSA